MALKICFRLKPQTLCMVVLNANHYTRTDDKSNDEIITISNKKICSKSLNYFSETFII